MASFSWDIPMSEQHDNERDKILNELDRLLWFHFPDEKLAGNSPYWGQEPYRGDLFALCCQALGLVNGDQVFQHIRSHWNIQRQHPLSENDQLRLDQLESAWGEWQYAMRRLDKHDQP